MQPLESHAAALAISMDHHRILSLARKNVARRLLSSLPSAPRNIELTDGHALRAKTPSVLLPQRRSPPLAALLIQLRQRERPYHELHALGDCLAHPDTVCNCVKVNIMGQSPVKAWSVLGKRFKERRATTEGASSPQEASPPRFSRCSSDPPRLLTPMVSASKRVHRRASCDTAAPSAKDDTAFAFAAGGSRPAPPAGARPAGALRSLAARARPARPDSAEAPITPSAFVAQRRQKCEKLLPAPESKPNRIALPTRAQRSSGSLGVPRGGKRSGVPSAPQSN